MDFTETLKLLLEKNDKNPNTPEYVLELAQHYDTYASLGILDPLRKKEIGENALTFYKEYLRLNPKDFKIEFSVGRLLFQLGNYERFIQWYHHFKEQQPHVPQLSKTGISMYSTNCIVLIKLQWN